MSIRSFILINVVENKNKTIIHTSYKKVKNKMSIRSFILINVVVLPIKNKMSIHSFIHSYQ